MSLTIFFIFIFPYTAYGLHCFDEDFGPVDWFVVYKLPRSENSDNELIKNGVAYVYITSATPSLTLSKFGVDDEQSIVAKHVNIYRKDRKIYTNLVYNDVLPNGSRNETAGHSRGFILANWQGGFWITHTLPGFPRRGANYTYPESGKEKGEFFTCISMNLKNLDKVGISLTYRQPQIYSSRVTSDIAKSLPKLTSLIRGDRSVSDPWTELNRLESSGRMKIVSFSKSREFNGDLYTDLVAPKLEVEVLVRSAISEEDGLKSICGDRRNYAVQVENIQTLFIKAAGITITNAEDNAKWLIPGFRITGGLFCIGDMDRNEREEHRGGGATCIFSRALVNEFRDMIQSVEKCP